MPPMPPERKEKEVDTLKALKLAFAWMGVNVTKANEQEYFSARAKVIIAISRSEPQNEDHSG